jgi:hypothetical protein
VRCCAERETLRVNPKKPGLIVRLAERRGKRSTRLLIRWHAIWLDTSFTLPIPRSAPRTKGGQDDHIPVPRVLFEITSKEPNRHDYIS